MTVDEAFQIISDQKPSTVYVSGKTSTGKSTFGRKLRDQLDYQVIELEAVLLAIVREHGFDEQSTFRKVLSEPAESLEKTLMLEATDRIISQALANRQPVVIEGAVANVATLQRILQPAANLFFLYFHPANLDVYIRNLTKRFMESNETTYGGLPRTFWQLIDDGELTAFRKNLQLTEPLKAAIRQYALASQAESLTRLNEYRQEFGDIRVAEIQ